jgi:hypothetical protein
MVLLLFPHLGVVFYGGVEELAALCLGMVDEAAAATMPWTFVSRP